MSKSAAARKIESAFTVVESHHVANDNARPQTAQDAMLAEIDAGYLRLHRRAFRSSVARFTVVYTVELETEELVLAYTGSRVESWRVMVTEAVGVSRQSFTLQVR